MNYYPVQEESNNNPSTSSDTTYGGDQYRMKLDSCNHTINKISKEPIDICSKFNADDTKYQELTNINDDIAAVNEKGIQSIRPGLYSISNFI